MAKWSVQLLDGRFFLIEADEYTRHDDVIDFHKNHRYIIGDAPVEVAVDEGGLIHLASGQELKSSLEHVAYFERSKIVSVIKEGANV